MAAKEVYNFEISDKNFDDIVITNSQKLPVFVLFMSPALPACISMESALIEYANEFAGQFILARLDTDMNPDAPSKLNVQNLPTLQVYHQGEKVFAEEGTMTFENLEALFQKFGIFNPAKALRAQAEQKHSEGQTAEAMQLLAEAAKLDPSNIDVAMDMCQIFLDLNMLAEGAELFTRLPDKIKEQERPRYLIGQITFKKLALDTAGKAVLIEKLAENPDDEETQFDLTICLIAEQDYQTGMAHLFKLLSKNANAKQGGAQELAIGIINMLSTTQPTLANDLRRQLNSIIT